MDKNNIIGFVLIAAVLIGFGIWSQPSAEQIAAQQKQDSIENVARAKAENAAKMAAKVIPFMFENDGEDLDTKPVRTAKHRYKTKTHRKNLTVKDGQEAIEKVNKKKQIQKESASHSKTQSKGNKRHQQKGIS